MKSPKIKSGAELRKTNPRLKDVAKRGEMRSVNRKLGDKMAELDDDVHREILLAEPLLELPGVRNLKTIIGYPEQSPCSCLAEMIYYPARLTFYIFWDVRDIMKTGLPPPNGKVYCLNLKTSIIVLWFHERT